MNYNSNQILIWDSQRNKRIQNPFLNRQKHTQTWEPEPEPSPFPSSFYTYIYMNSWGVQDRKRTKKHSFAFLVEQIWLENLTLFLASIRREKKWQLAAFCCRPAAARRAWLRPACCSFRAWLRPSLDLLFLLPPAARYFAAARLGFLRFRVWSLFYLFIFFSFSARTAALVIFLFRVPVCWNVQWEGDREAAYEGGSNRNTECLVIYLDQTGSPFHRLNYGLSSSLICFLYFPKAQV